MDSSNPHTGKELAETLHQLNQPLTAINNYAQAGSAMLASGAVDPEALQELFNKIARQSSRSFEISREMQRQVQQFSDSADRS